MKSKNLNVPELNAGSMADIAFLLLIFFLVTTTILQEKGLTLQLPPQPENRAVVKQHKRNVFRILINSNNQYLIEGKTRTTLDGLKEEVKDFILNEKKSPLLSESPEKAIVSLKTQRGTTYKCFIGVLDELKSAYYEIYAGRVGLSPAAYRQLDEKDPVQQMKKQRGKEGVPMNISIALPD